MMDKYLHPVRFDCEPNRVGADKQWTHWIKTFENFAAVIEPTRVTNDDGTTVNKLTTLTNYFLHIYEFIANSTIYGSAVNILKKNYVRYILVIRKQADGESLDTYKY